MESINPTPSTKKFRPGVISGEDIIPTMFEEIWGYNNIQERISKIEQKQQRSSQFQSIQSIYKAQKSIPLRIAPLRPLTVSFDKRAKAFLSGLDKDTRDFVINLVNETYFDLIPTPYGDIRQKKKGAKIDGDQHLSYLYDIDPFEHSRHLNLALASIQRAIFATIDRALLKILNGLDFHIPKIIKYTENGMYQSIPLIRSTFSYMDKIFSLENFVGLFGFHHTINSSNFSYVKAINFRNH